MRNLLIIVVIAVSACRTVPSSPDPTAFSGQPACPVTFTEEVDAINWRKPVVTVAQTGGIIMGVAGPGIAIVGIAADDNPGTPPVEMFVVGGAVMAAGVASIVVGGVVADDAEKHAAKARDAFANPCG